MAALVGCITVSGQVGDPGTLIQEKLAGQMKMTKTAADRSDIVTAGDVVLLNKDGMIMCSSDSAYPGANIYVGGVLKLDPTGRGKDAAKNVGKSLFGRVVPFGSLAGGGGSVTDALNNGCTQRKFVAGEKFWVTGVSLQKDGILVSTFSDAYNDKRYYGQIKFVFPKSGPVPPVDDFLKTVNEVMTVQPAEDKSDTQTASKDAAPAPAATPVAPMAAIAPPPPPADAPPPSISVGQTKDQVTAGFGQPMRTAKLAGTKEIYFYKDMKVTFLNGKVSKVE